jgi:hypothetical protein
VYSFVRPADGTLHIVRPSSDNGAQGLSEDSISASGAIQYPVTALSTDWGVSVPGLLTLPNGSLEAFFGAGEPGTSDTSAWGITSSDGGNTWTAPLDIRSGPLEDLAYAAELRAEMNGTTPTRFEPVQHLSEKIITLFHLAGDGRLGPLDLLADQISDTNPLLPAGVYHARVLPELSAAVAVKAITAIKNKQKVVTAHTLTVTVTDAGDAVSGATVTVKGHTKKTNSKGAATITLPGAGAGKVTVSVTAPTYQKLSKSLKL